MTESIETKEVDEMEEVDETEEDNRPIWPGRPEVIFSQYLANRDTWLAAHPIIQTSQYRIALGLKSWSIQWCKQQVKYLPKQRLDIKTERLLDGDPNWSIEEIQA